MIVEFACARTQDHEERREGAYARDELNVPANAPSPLLPKSSVQKGEAYFRELTVFSQTIYDTMLMPSSAIGHSKVRPLLQTTLNSLLCALLMQKLPCSWYVLTETGIPAVLILTVSLHHKQMYLDWLKVVV